MKTIEEKAKAYDEAIERAKRFYDSNTNEGYRRIFEDIFPELKESEDEKIRKELIEYHKAQAFLDGKPNNKHVKYVAWLEKQGNLMGALQEANKKIGELVEENYYLKEDQKGKLVLTPEAYERVLKLGEKQGEQKPVDKTEPKFKVGDWIVYQNETFQVIKDASTLILQGKRYRTYFIEEACRPWTIQDAKDGDVLTVDNIIFIYKRILASHIVSYCKLINDVFESTVDVRTCCEGNAYVHPATKEQRDLLFQKMKVSGYEWDAEKKELKNIEHNPAWSEEDEEILNLIIARLHSHPNVESEEYNKDYHWFKSLRPQKKQEHIELNWLDEANNDEELLIAIEALEKAGQHSSALWVKHLADSYPQSQWKPSEEQMEALKGVQEGVFRLGILESLYQDLKKLKG